MINIASCSMLWDCIAYDELSNAIHCDCIACDKLSCAMQRLDKNNCATHCVCIAYDKLRLLYNASELNCS